MLEITEDISDTMVISYDQHHTSVTHQFTTVTVSGQQTSGLGIPVALEYFGDIHFGNITTFPNID